MYDCVPKGQVVWLVTANCTYCPFWPQAEIIIGITQISVGSSSKEIARLNQKVAVWVAVQRRASAYTEDRSSPLVQPERI
jgi:hypothetical protein